MPINCENYQQNLSFCNCSYPGCPRKGNCCACLQYHLQSKELPACAFPSEVEKQWDRSFQNFIRVHSKK